MSIAYEKNVDFAVDTDVLRKCGGEYVEVATELRTLAKELNAALEALKNTGWTTPAGHAFQKMADTNWSENIEKYASLLDTLNDILNEAAGDYESFITNYVEKAKL